MSKIQTQLRNDQVSVYRLFAFNAQEEQKKLFENEKNVVMIPTMSNDENLVSFFENEIQALIDMTATHFAQDIIQLKGETHTIALFNAKEELPTNQTKMKKRKSGRSLKLCGDLCLILGCADDANNYYKQALELLKSNEDYLWVGKIIEAMSACLLLRYQNKDVIDSVAVENDIILKMREGTVYFRKAKHSSFDNECFVKLLRFFRDFNSKVNFIECCRAYMETPQMSVVPDENYKVLLKLAGFCYDLQMYRKAGFFLRIAAAAIANDGYNESLALEVFLSSFPLYHMPITKEILPDSFPKNNFLNIIKKNTNLPRTIKRTWPKLQCQLLNDTMSLASQDIPLQTKLISIVLHYFLEDLDPQAQFQLFGELIRLGSSINKTIKLDLSFIPEFIKLTPITENIRVNIREIKPGSENKGIFIFNPWKKLGGQALDFNWMAGNICYVKVLLRNIFKFEIFIDMLMLVTEGVDTINYPTSLIMKNTSELQELTLKFKPLKTGQVNILGVISKFTNFMHFHPIDAKGFKIDGYQEESHKDIIGLKGIPIKEKVNTMKIYFEEQTEIIDLYECSHFCIKAIAENNQECVITIHKIQVSFAFKDNTTLDKDLVPSFSQLRPFDFLSLVIHRSLPEDENIIKSTYKGQSHAIINTHDIGNIDKLFKIYVKIIYFEKEKPTIHVEENLSKEINMKRGLAIQKLHVYDSLEQASIEISGKMYEHYNLDDVFYLGFDVAREDLANKDEFTLLFNVGIGSKMSKVIVEKVISQNEVATKVILTVNRSILINNAVDPTKVKEILYGRWKKTNSINNGYFFFDKTEFRSFMKKIESRKISISFDVNIVKNNKRYEALSGELYNMKLKIQHNEKLTKSKSFFCSVVITDNMDNESLSLQKKEKGVLFHGKKTLKVELNEKENEKTHSISVMFTEKKMFKIFCFLLDEEEGCIYSYRHPEYILVQ